VRLRCRKAMQIPALEAEGHLLQRPRLIRRHRDQNPVWGMSTGTSGRLTVYVHNRRGALSRSQDYSPWVWKRGVAYPTVLAEVEAARDVARRPRAPGYWIGRAAQRD
jgi:hypothetical protein